jgi:hypothetical protein
MTKVGTDLGSSSSNLYHRLGDSDSVVFIRSLCAVLPSLHKSTLSGLVREKSARMGGAGVAGIGIGIGIGTGTGTGAVGVIGYRHSESTIEESLHADRGLSNGTSGGGGRGDLGGRGDGDQSLIRLVVRSACVGYSCLDSRRRRAAAALVSADTRDGNPTAGTSASAGTSAPLPSMAVDQEGVKGGGNGGSADRREEEILVFVQSAADVIVTLAHSESEVLKTVKSEKSMRIILTEAIEEVTRVLQSRGASSFSSEVVFAQRICSAELLTAVVQGLLSAKGTAGGEICVVCVWCVYVWCVVYVCVCVFTCVVCVWCVCMCVVCLYVWCVVYVCVCSRVWCMCGVWCIYMCVCVSYVSGSIKATAARTVRTPGCRG